LGEWIYGGGAAASVMLDSTGPHPEVFLVEIVFGRISNVVKKKLDLFSFQTNGEPY